MTERPLRGMSDMLRNWRLRRDPQDVPEIRTLPVHMRRGAALTQALMAAATGVSERHYRRLETVGGKNFSSAFLANVVRILALNEAESAALYIWAEHEPPVHEPIKDLDASLIRYLNEQTHAAYYSDIAYDIVGTNRLAAIHFPWLAVEGANIMQWSLGPDTGSREQLLQWEEYWAAPMIAQLRMAAVKFPDHQRLREVIREVRRNPAVRRIWDEDEPRVVAHAYGDIRPIAIPTLGVDETWIQIVAFTPLHRPDLRLVVASPVDPEIREPSLADPVP
jgi:MmyB-like transcription regulator ligand binding domain/Helix-turn-helix domain